MSKIAATLSNVVDALSNGAKCGFEFQYHDKSAFFISVYGTGKWRPVTDAEIVDVRLALEQQGFAPVSKSIARDAMIYIGAESVKGNKQP